MEDTSPPKHSDEKASPASDKARAAEPLEPCFIFDADPEHFPPDFTHFRTASNAATEPASNETKARAS